MATPRHNVNGWELESYEWASGIGTFVYSRQSPEDPRVTEREQHPIPQPITIGKIREALAHNPGPQLEGGAPVVRLTR